MIAAEFIRVAIEEHIATVTLDRPPVNSFNERMLHEGGRVFEELDADKDVRVVVVTGGAGRTFSAGNDVRDLQDRSPAVVESHRASFTRFCRALNGCTVPIIGAINGHALGTGCAIAMACDLLVATPEATFGLPEIQVGAISGEGPTRLLPANKARWLALSGVPIGAEEVYRFGGIERLVPLELLMPTAMEYARMLTRLPPLSLRIAKRCILETEFPKWEGQFTRLQEYLKEAWSTEDATEAARAFVEKRKPRYNGR